MLKVDDNVALIPGDWDGDIAHPHVMLGTVLNTEDYIKGTVLVQFDIDKVWGRGPRLILNKFLINRNADVDDGEDDVYRM